MDGATDFYVRPSSPSPINADEFATLEIRLTKARSIKFNDTQIAVNKRAIGEHALSNVTAREIASNEPAIIKPYPL